MPLGLNLSPAANKSDELQRHWGAGCNLSQPLWRAIGRAYLDLAHARGEQEVYDLVVGSTHRTMNVLVGRNGIRFHFHRSLSPFRCHLYRRQSAAEHVAL